MLHWRLSEVDFVHWAACLGLIGGWGVFTFV